MDPQLPTGSEIVCFDAGPLIHFNDAGALVELNSWFDPGTCFTAQMVRESELAKSVSKFPQNQAILDAPWLRTALVEDEDLRIVATLRALWGSPKGRDYGEAEIVALCKRYGWTAVMNDRRGRDAARKYDIPVVSTAGLVVGAAAWRILTVDSAWDLHTRVEGGFTAPMILPTTDDFRLAFERAVAAVQRLVNADPDVLWPATLAMSPAVDDILERAVAAVRSGVLSQRKRQGETRD